jgi:phosphatidylglycerophosphatase GEP4
MAQSWNLAGVLYFPYARFFRKSLMIPHFWVKNINNIDIEKLKFYGFEGLVFDKDNTLTEPYTDEVHPKVKRTFDQCKDLYKDRILIVSNHAGTKDDPDHIKAMTIEQRLGVPVLKHDWKKPFAGEATLNHFTERLGHECDPTKLVMFGDMLFTDIIFGNRYGMLTVLVDDLKPKSGNSMASRIKRYSNPLVESWMEDGMKAQEHALYHEDIKKK